MGRIKYLLVVAALVSWLAKLSLDYVSDIADWFWYIAFGCRIALFLLALCALFRLGCSDFAMFSVTLVITVFPVFGIGWEPVDWLQEKIFRVYALHRIASVPLEQFLSSCKLIDYVEDGGARQRVGPMSEATLRMRHL